MEFRRLRLAGFKSFVEPAELRIEPGLTGVVGPNGCGKSNLLEALRWVMGEGSPKSMRSGGMDDVIFAGTAQRPARSFAAVTLALAGAGGEEVEVSRRIERGAGSDYRVNGRDTRLQDVRLLFADNATGAHSPAIVGQGRIGEIIAAKPTDRRLLLEEAAGIAGLHVRRREAEIRLRAAEANVARLDDVVRALEAQAASLRRQAKAAERYRALSDRLKVAEARLVHARWAAAVAAADAAAKAATDIDAQVGALTRVAATLAATVADQAAGVPALRQSEADAAAAQQALGQSRALLDAERQALGRRLADLERDRAAVRRDLAREATLADEAVTAGERLSAEDARLAEQLAAITSAAPQLAAAVANAEADAGMADASLAEAIAAHAAAAAEQRAAEATLSEANARAARAEQEVERFAAARARLRPVADVVPLADARDHAEAALQAAEARLVEAEATLPAVEAARSEAASRLAGAKAALSALASEADALARRLAADGGSAGAGAGPRIADRIEPDAGYEAAVAAALGDAIDAAGADSDAPRRWAGTVANNDPGLPNGISALSRFVAAPPELARRLAQTGVVEAEPSAALLAPLRPGQRLVTLAGALWRWDGFVDTGGRADAAAARLRARRRAVELEAERTQAQAVLQAAESAYRDAEASHAAGFATERAARDARSAAVRAAEAARAALANAETAAARAAGEAETLAAAEARAVADRDRLRAEAAGARERLGLGEIVRGLAQQLSVARTAADASRAGLAAARAAADRSSREAEAAAVRRATIAAERDAWTRRVAVSAEQRRELAARGAATESEAARLAARQGEIATELAALATRTAAADADRRAASDALAAAESALRDDERRARVADEAVVAAREARAAARADAEHAEAARLECEKQCGDRFACPPPLLPGRFGFPPEAGEPHRLQGDFDALTFERERLGPVNLRADIELAELDEQAKITSVEKAELDTAIARLRGSIGNLNREGRTRLAQAFEAVDRHFRALFTGLFGGGEARLELIDSEDPLEAGLEIMAQPPGKKLQSLNLLSGGEQALTATALIFGLFLANPAPICVLDEVDAPLDDANVERFCDLLDRMAADTATRFLIVTHNAVTMSRMHRLYGVTMGEPGVSQLVSVDLQGAEELLAAE